MEGLIYEKGTYETRLKDVSFLSRITPSLRFYATALLLIVKAGAKAKKHSYDNNEWCKDCLHVLLGLENVGVRFEITGIDYLSKVNGPCVFVANHMSTLETFVLPAIIEPFKDVTFVVKKSLLAYPFFGQILRSREAIVVSRKNPRSDLVAVLEGGTKRLKSGRSIIVFPQTTRSSVFDPEKFNTLGIKLAKRANVPIIPLALKTDAWRNGRYLKDVGKIDPSRIVYFSFGEPLWIKDRDMNGHNIIINFVKKRLKEWAD